MPKANGFRHQDYTDVPASLWEMVTPVDTHLNDDARAAQLRAAGAQMSAAGVRVIYVVHGTLTGTDASGVLGELGRIWPAWSSSLKKQGKRLVDAVMGTTANYDDSFVDAFRDGINAGLSDPIDVRRFVWSSQNHTLGRADAAVQLLAELKGLELKAGSRVLLWGHSHAGNVFALLTNLLGGDVKTRARFFRAARSYYRKPGSGRVDVPIWQQVRKMLSVAGNPLQHLGLDIVTFGTPIRYGWDTGGYGQLLHFTNHVPTDGLPVHCVPFPPSLEQLNAAAAGDFVQQFFIAGTNFPPTIFAFRSWTAERRLNRLIQKSHRRRDLWERLQQGHRIADEGRTLLVDYAQGDVESAQLLAGHAVYTKRRWLPFHVEKVVEALYGKKDGEKDG